MALNVIEPTGWQDTVIRVPQDINLALFGGRGAGRTTAALFASMEHCELYNSRARVLFLRQTLRSLKEVEDSFQLMLSSGYGGGLRVNRQDHEFRLPNGAKIEFAPLNDVEDMAKLQGRSFSLIVADEYGNFSPAQMKFVDQLRANLRAGKETPTRMILLANPGGRGHQQIKTRFIDRMIPGVPGFLEDGTVWAWMPANYTVNPHNPTNYKQDLFAASGKDKELFAAWTEGRWNIARGAMFADCLDELVHKFPGKGRIFDPKDKGVVGFLSGDWGQSAPAVAFACWRLLEPRFHFPRGSLILQDEVSSASPDDWSVGMNWSIGKFADNMSDMCDRTGVYKMGCIDDAKGLQPNDTLIGGLTAYGFSFIRPRKNRRSGWATMRELLVNAQERNGKPGMWVAKECHGFWETVPTLPRDPLNAEDVDTRAIDHWGDGARYAATYEPEIADFNNVATTLARYGIGAPTAAGFR